MKKLLTILSVLALSTSAFAANKTLMTCKNELNIMMNKFSIQRDSLTSAYSLAFEDGSELKLQQLSMAGQYVSQTDQVMVLVSTGKIKSDQGNLLAATVSYIAKDANNVSARSEHFICE